MDAEQQDKIAQFSAVTGANPSIAQTTLGSANWNLEEAVGLYFAANEPHDADEEEDEDDDDDDVPETIASSSNPQPVPSSARNARGGRPKQMTLQDLQRSADDEEDDEKPRDLFAGGEKSGLAVQNPADAGKPIDHFRNIMRQAQQNHDRPAVPGEEEQPARNTHFQGRAQTLGGDDAPSEMVEDPTAPRTTGQRQLPRVTRTLHLWADGVSIDDGPLLRFDDPANMHIMQEINQGRAPKALLDVEPDQEVDLNLDPHKGENYVAPKPKYKPFGGSGQRLGSPTPGLGSVSSSSAAPARSSTSASSATLQAEEVKVDDSQPTLQLQIRLGDGTRLSSRFNTDHTMADVYAFVNRAHPASQQRPYVLQTTFPVKEFGDHEQVLSEISEFKRGGVVVQKWK